MPTDLFDTRFVDCWVVHGSCGEYSDRHEWCIAVFLKEEDAKELVVRLDLLKLKHNLADTSQWENREVLVKAINDEIGFEAIHDSYQADSVRFYHTKAIFGG